MYLNLVDSVFVLKAEKLINPVCNAVGAAFIGDGNTWRPTKQFLRIENVIYMLISTQSISMNTSPSTNSPNPTNPAHLCGVNVPVRQ